MGKTFNELAHADTRLGELSLRSRRIISLDADVLEIKLGEEYLMSSLFTASEVALARLGLAELGGAEPGGAEPGLTQPGRAELEIVVGGLGLGYTARAVLESDRVRSLLVVEVLEPVLQWHESGLLPLGPTLTGDSRCRLVQGDFFALAASVTGLDAAAPGRQFDAILVDIDHTPEMLLHADNASFYTETGLAQLSDKLRPGGVFGLWSDDPPDERFVRRLLSVFPAARAEPVTFHNPILDQEYTQTVYLSRKAGIARGN